MPSETAASRDRRWRRQRRRPTTSTRMTLSAAHPSASASSPLGTTIGLALLLLVSDLTGKLPPSVMAERRRYYSGGQNYNYRQRSRSARARRDEQHSSQQKPAAGEVPSSSDQQQTTGPIRRMQDSKLLDQLFGEGFELTVKDTPECEACSDCGKSCVMVSIAFGGSAFSWVKFPPFAVSFFSLCLSISIRMCSQCLWR